MIKSIADIQKLVVAGEQDWAKYGRVDVRQKDNLILFSYNREAMYANEWTDFECLARGLIISTTGEVVARPFQKFFNWGQHYGGDRYAYPNDGTYLVNVFEKYDGSLGILYRDNGYKIATRGSFESEQAIWATNYLNKCFDLTDLPNEYTLLFEIIYPENRVVVNYGDYEDLILLGAVNRFTGTELPFHLVHSVAQEFGFTLAKVYNFDSPTQILANTAKLIGVEQEGYVLLYSDGSRYKVKGAEYLWLHKLISDLTPKRIYEAWAEGVKMDIPDEFATEVKLLVAKFEQTKQEIENTVNLIFAATPRENRKTFALAVKDSQYAGILFAMLDDNDERYKNLVLEMVKTIVL